MLKKLLKKWHFCIIRRMVRNCNRTDVNLTVYYSLIYSHIIYGICLWGCSTHNLNEVFRRQKRCIRVIAKINKRESCRAFFKEYSVMTVPALYIYHLILLYKKNSKEWGNLRLVNHHYNMRGNQLSYLPSH